jgi:hypothetical protein
MDCNLAYPPLTHSLHKHRCSIFNRPGASCYPFKPYIPFKKSATGRAGGSALWKKMFHYFQLNRDDFMEHYHKRSNIEATNAAIKRKFGETLKSKNPTAQVNELLAKIIAYNLTVVIHEMYENGIQPEFLQLTSEA